MAVIDDIEATVCVGDNPLKEYKDSELDDDGPKEASRYIEAESGKAFGVKFKLPKAYPWTSDGLTAEIHIDGTYATSALLPSERSAKRPTDYHWISKYSWFQTKHGEEWRPWLFSQVNQGSYVATQFALFLKTYNKASGE